MHWVTTLVIVVLIVLDLAVRAFAIVYVPIDRKPQTATAWLLAIFLIPFIGFILFLLLGSTKLPKDRREKQTEINEFILEQTEGMELVQIDDTWPNWLNGVVELLRSSADTFDAMTEAVDQAERYVHVEFYIATLDASTSPFFDALDAAIGRGVRVKFLLDHIASRGYPGYKATTERLAAMGAEWHLMLPVLPLQGKFQRPDLRNHRKLLVVDGEVAFTGSQNLIDPSYDNESHIEQGMRWKDLMARFEGPVVAGINALFLTDWYSETGDLLREREPARRAAPQAGMPDTQVVPSGPGFDGENNLRLFNAMLYSAQERVSVVSPYFVPDESMLYAITTAAQRGVAVELFGGEIGDHALTWHAQRSYYEGLLRAGVRIWLYPAPTILHTKFFTIDDDVSVIGSSNMDMRSFSLNLEISVMVRSHGFVDELRAVLDDYRARSTEVQLDEWCARPLRSRVLDNVARLTAALQ
jgi:cardiolipin synthase A/B